jgi:hypothetical protein
MIVSIDQSMLQVFKFQLHKCSIGLLCFGYYYSLHHFNFEIQFYRHILMHLA